MGAFAQIYSPLEIVFVDDASTDNGFEIAQRIAAQYQGPHRIVVTRYGRHGGVGEQWERVLTESRGEIMVYADTDDISLPDRCQRIYEAFRDGGPELLGVDSYCDLIDARGAPITGVPPHIALNRFSSEHLTAEMLARNRNSPLGAVLAVRRIVFEVGVPLASLRRVDDSALAFRCLVLGRMKTIPEVLVLRRSHLDNVSAAIDVSWSGKTLGAWFSKHLDDLTPVPAVMRQDLDKFARDGLISAARAHQLRREVDLYAHEVELQRLAQRMPWWRWRRWTLYFALRRLGIGRRPAIRLALLATAPALAIMFLRRNPVHRAARQAAAG